MNSPWPERLDLIVFDFDGVMTDGRVLVMADGSEGVMCNRSDGLGIDFLRDANIPMLILSTETNPVVAARARKLQLPVIHGVKDKAALLAQHLSDHGISPANVAFVGNDNNDLGCLKLAGLSVVVADAYPDVIEVADIILKNKGGHGAVREFCDLILKHYSETTT